MEDNDRVLSAADLDILRLGREFELLVKSPAWRLTLDWMEMCTNIALEDHKLSLSTDPLISHALRMRWVDREHTLKAFQLYVYGKIEAKRNLVSLLLESGIAPSQLENALSLIPPTVAG
jgi:hypothetical protein